MDSPLVQFDRVEFRQPSLAGSRRASARQAHGGPPVLKQVTLSVNRAETVALVGRSGAGKSTLLRLVNRLLTPSAGRVTVDGRDTREWDAIRLRRQVGYVIQDVGLFPHMTIAENVAVVPRLEGWPEARISERTRELLDLVGLPAAEFSGRRPHQLSGGQRQRVGVARALAIDPPILLMDEPFGALDPVTRAEVRDEFTRLKKRLRTTVLMVTHDIAEAFALGDRVGVLDAGELVAFDTPSQVAASNDVRVRALIGRAPPGPSLMAVIRFWTSHAPELLNLLLQHLMLVLVSTVAAIVIGIPAGIFAARRPRLGRLVLVAASAAQTVPSLALLGFLLPLPFIGGVGPRTALVALSIYALLPIMRTTVTGIRTIDASIVEAGLAMGMTPRQLLWLVELPLALPSIITGVRVATVIGVGTATIAAAIGAGGLGEYIFRGLAMVDSTTILAGAIPAAMLALAADGLLAWTERGVRDGHVRIGILARVAGAAAALLIFAIGAGGYARSDVDGGRGWLKELHRAGDPR